MFGALAAIWRTMTSATAARAPFRGAFIVSLVPPGAMASALKALIAPRAARRSGHFIRKVSRASPGQDRARGVVTRCKSTIGNGEAPDPRTPRPVGTRHRDE